ATLSTRTTSNTTTDGKSVASANEAGKAVFLVRCGSCHTLQAAGTTGTAGPHLGVAGRLSIQTITNAVTQGKSGPLGTMPAFAGTLTKDQIEQVASYVAEVTAR